MPTTYDADTLAPVTTSVQRLPVAGEAPMAEITVRADRIPWYFWLTAGVFAGWVLANALPGRRAH